MKFRYFKTNLKFNQTSNISSNFNIVEDTEQLKTHNHTFQFLTEDFKNQIDDNELVIAAALNDLNTRLENIEQTYPIIVKISIAGDYVHYQNNESSHTYQLTITDDIDSKWGNQGNYIDELTLKEIIGNSIQLHNLIHLPSVKFLIYKIGESEDDVVIVSPSMNIHPYNGGVTLKFWYKDPVLGDPVNITLSSTIDNGIITMNQNGSYIVGE